MRPLPDPVETIAEPAGTRSRVARLFEEFAPALRAFLLRRLGNIEDAREGAQEIFLNLWRREQLGELKEEARAYLFVAADNWAKDCRRKARTHVVDKHEPMEERHEQLLQEPDGEDIVHWQGGLDMVLKAVGELGPTTQRIFDLHFGRHMTYTEIAKALGITARTVERHMAHAIAHCKLRLKAYL